MPIAVVQEFPLEGDDRSTSNYDRVQDLLGVRDDPPAGGLVHTAGFDQEAGVFRIFDVWETEEDWSRFRDERLMPAVAPMIEAGAREPTTRVYRLHDFMS